MAHYDIFNGDADGICSLIQLRLADPKNTTLVTGVKRDIQLLQKVDFNAGDTATVLDISMEKNHQALVSALGKGVSVFYADHHRAGDIPSSTLLEAHINTASTTCTGLIIDYYLDGKHREWAIVAAFGDNMLTAAEEYCRQLGLSVEEISLLKKLGVAMNYNGYGSSEADLYYSPVELYQVAVRYESPFEFISQEPEVFNTLTKGYDDDLVKGLTIPPDKESETAAMISLPDERWARRVSGVLGNELANKHPGRAHAILTKLPDKPGHFQISIRAPKNNPTAADSLAMQFGGGGRKSAAGINDIAEKDLSGFWQALEATYA
jgi:hypothetical protein